LSLCPEVDEGLVREHIKRLSDDYFDRFDLDDIARHLRGLAKLGPDSPVELLIDPAGDGYSACTVLAYDSPSVFSLITGVFCAAGANIVSGDVFTWARSLDRGVARSAPRPKPRSPGRPSPRGRRAPPEPDWYRRCIVDRFLCAFEEDGGGRDADAASKRRLRRLLDDVFSLLAAGDDAAIVAARHRVNEKVTARLVELRGTEQPVLYPVEIEFDNDIGSFTRLSLLSQDTPAFLYSISSALALQGCSIEHVHIRTVEGRVRDVIDFLDKHGHQIDDDDTLQGIRLCALLTKQFTYFLDRAPDPYTALSRFEQLVEGFLKIPEDARSVDLTDPRLMKDLARLLGASDFLWEDFIRLQYEALLPVLESGGDRRRQEEPVGERLAAALAGATTLQERRDRLNRFKDDEIVLIDLDHILDPEVNFRCFAGRLTALAEEVIRVAAQIVWDGLVERYGRPLTVAGLEAPWAIFGLGKLGGGALGYASDIEILLVYGDNGRTDGESYRTNTEFFNEMALDLAKLIRAKREGIFEVDLRLRPYGKNGPNACSLESFCTYYGVGGDAHSVERLALVRMRAVAGDPDLGARVERLRDELTYASRNVNPEEIYEVRVRQYEDRRKPGRYNAKYSPGALVDLEYTVQLLQVLYSPKYPKLQTPSIHRGLEELRSARVIADKECRRLTKAYVFFRQLINGLRMLRGSAKDLYLPELDSDEFLHLARRMGYETQDGLGPEQQLHVEFETRSAAVRTFVTGHLGKDSLPGPPSGNVADLLLAENPPDELVESTLDAVGFRDVTRAFANLRSLAGDEMRSDAFTDLAVLACDFLRTEPDPDMALNNWERFLGELDHPVAHFRLLLSQPQRLAFLLGVFSRSQFLADTLIRNPAFFDWATEPSRLHPIRKRRDLVRELRGLSRDHTDRTEWCNAMRLFVRREVLRIGARDMCLRVPLEEVTTELSKLAEAVVQVTLRRSWRMMSEAGEVPPSCEELPDRFCVLAFGKLGGAELNYSSDIDLLAVFDDMGLESSGPHRRELEVCASEVVRRLCSDLTEHTAQGYAYRVDLRLRPFGGVGEIVSSITALETYYRDTAKLWEVQALLKLRPIAGNTQVGYDCVERLRPLLFERRERGCIAREISAMRDLVVSEHAARSLGSGFDVKNGAGGIRDIEFLCQGLQLAGMSEQPALLTGNTLEALNALDETGILESDEAAQLADDYRWLRCVEHQLQILHNRQTHTIPESEDELEALARCVCGAAASGAVFLDELERRRKRVRQAYLARLIEGEEVEP